MAVTDDCITRNGFNSIHFDDDRYKDKVPVAYSLYYRIVSYYPDMLIFHTDEGCVMFVYEEFDTLKEDSVLVSISARICNDEDFEIALKYFDLGAII